MARWWAKPPIIVAVLGALAILTQHTSGSGSPTVMALRQEVRQALDTGHFTQVETLLRQAHELGPKHLGPKNPDVATSLNNLGLLYQAQGRYADAEPRLQQALAIREKVLGPEHPDVATSLNNLVALLRATNRDAEAVQLEARRKRPLSKP
jgi:hypothetical protein